VPRSRPKIRDVRAVVLFCYVLRVLTRIYREHQSSEQAVPDTVMEAPPVSALTQQKSSTKKSWIRSACGKCIEAKHLINHQKICGTMYRGKTHNCSQKECRNMLSALWQANFLRSDDCRHSSKDNISKVASQISEPIARHGKRPPTQDCSVLSRKKVSGPRYEGPRASRGTFTERTEQQSNSSVAERSSISEESARTLHKASGLPELVCTSSHKN
jgi:hypothetical protein